MILSRSHLWGCHSQSWLTQSDPQHWLFHFHHLSFISLISQICITTGATPVTGNLKKDTKGLCRGRTHFIEIQYSAEKMPCSVEECWRLHVQKKKNVLMLTKQCSIQNVIEILILSIDILAMSEHLMCESRSRPLDSSFALPCTPIWTLSNPTASQHLN